MNSPSSNFYVTGGTLRIDAPCYVERKADHDLLAALLRGDFCYVLTARQMGKSSLMVRTASRLRERGVHVAVLDLTAIGQNLTAEQWYNGLLFRMAQQLNLEEELDTFWEAHQQLGPCQRLFAALSEVALRELDHRTQLRRSNSPATPNDRPPEEIPPGSLVVFIDELDSVRSLPFSTDEFFAAIRECYNRRTQDAQFRRLAFALLGVATPGDLIRDTRSSPFNIGRRIELRDFTWEESLPLAQGLGEPIQARRLLQRIHYWTNGHPYLTQRFCRAVAETASPETPLTSADVEPIDRLCFALFLSRVAREQEDNLLFVRDRILRSEADRSPLLELYRRVKRSRPKVSDDHANPLVNVLHLSGIVGSDAGFLRERNRIYARTFDEAWIDDNLPVADLARQRAAYRRGAALTASVSLVILSVILLLAWQWQSAVHTRIHQAEQLRRAADDIRTTTIQLAVSRGIELGSQGDWPAASLWFAEAQALEIHGAAAAEPAHRLRLAFAFLQAPAIAQMWFPEGNHFRAEFAPAQNQIVIGEPAAGIQFCDLASGAVTPAAFARGEHFAAISPDGRRVATCRLGAEAEVVLHLWDLERRRLERTLSPAGSGIAPPLTGIVHSVAFSPDGGLVAAALGPPAGGVLLWETRDGHSGRRLADPEAAGHAAPPMLKVAFDPRGRQLALAGAEGRLALWDLQTGAPVRAFRGHRGTIHEIAYSHDGRKMASTGSDGTVRLWETDTGRQICAVSHEENIVEGIAFSPNDETFATGGWDMTVRRWSCENGRPLLPSFRESAPIRQVAFSPNGELLLSLTHESVMRAWQLRKEPLCPEAIHAVYSGDGRHGLELRPDGWRWFRVDQERRRSTVQDLPQTAQLRLNQDGETILAWHAVAPTDARASVQARRWSTVTGQPSGTPFRLDVASDQIVLSPDGRQVAVIEGTVVRILEASSGREVWCFDNLLASSAGFAFDPQWQWVAVADHHQVRFHSLRQPRTPVTTTLGPVTITRLAVSPDGLRLAAVGRQAAPGPSEVIVCKFIANTGRVEIESQLPVPEGVRFLAFDPARPRLLIGGEQHTAVLWGFERGARRVLRLRHGGAVIHGAFSASGEWIAVLRNGPGDAADPVQTTQWLQLWDAGTGGPLTVIPLGAHRALIRTRFVGQDHAIAIEDSQRACWLVRMPRGETRQDQYPPDYAQLLSGRNLFTSDLPVTSDTLFQHTLEMLERASSGELPRPLTRRDSALLWQQPGLPAARPSTEP